MKVTVKTFLYVRTGKPSVNAPTYQYLAPGSEIEVDGQLYKGDLFEGVDTWVKDEVGNFYWSGGVEMPILPLPEPMSLAIDRFNEKDFWWIEDFNIGKLWSKGLSGKGVKIAVLDSGLALPHPDLILEEGQLKDFSQSKSGIADQIGHGTHVVGIIKASNNGFGIKGLAFNSDVYFGKITNDLRGDKEEYLIKAIEWAIGVNVDIISISAGFIQGSVDLKSALDEAEKHDILVVCAAGNKDETTGADILYPARYQTTLSVGGLTKNGDPLPDTINSKQTDLFAPGEKILSTYLEPKYFSLSGSSQSAPYAAGVACLILESKRKSSPSYKAKDLKNALLANADLAQFGKKINPLNTLQ